MGLKLAFLCEEKQTLELPTELNGVVFEEACVGSGQGMKRSHVDCIFC